MIVMLLGALLGAVAVAGTAWENHLRARNPGREGPLRRLLPGTLRVRSAAELGLVRAHPRECHCHGLGVVDPTVRPPTPCPVVWLPRTEVAPDRVGWLPRGSVR